MFRPVPGNNDGPVETGPQVRAEIVRIGGRRRIALSDIEILPLGEQFRYVRAADKLRVEKKTSPIIKAACDSEMSSKKHRQCENRRTTSDVTD